MKALLDGNANVEWQDRDGFRPLHNAAYGGHCNVLRLLMETPYLADVFARNNRNESAADVINEEEVQEMIFCERLRRSVYELTVTARDFEALKEILDAGARCDFVDGNGMQALHKAAESGDVPVIDILISRGAGIANRVREVDMAPLHYAARNGRTSAVEILAKRGADVRLQDKIGRTALHHAAENGHASVVETLLACKAPAEQKDGEGCSPLHRAAYRGHADIAESLIISKANLESECNLGRRAIHYAAMGKSIDVIKLLVSTKHLAEIDAEDCQSRSALDLSADLPTRNTLQAEKMRRAVLKAAIKGDYVELYALIEMGADVGFVDGQGRTPLHFASVNGHQRCVKSLLQANAVVTATDKEGLMSLHQACRRGFDGVVRLLLENGAEVDSKTQGFLCHPLHFAAAEGHAEVVATLIMFKADTGPVDYEGRRPLHRAAENGNADVVEQLLKANVDQAPKDFYGDSAFAFASRNGHTYVVERFSERHRHETKIRQRRNRLAMLIGLIVALAVVLAVGIYLSSFLASSAAKTGAAGAGGNQGEGAAAASEGGKEEGGDDLRKRIKVKSAGA